jgi:hypothetical protein
VELPRDACRRAVPATPSEIISATESMDAERSADPFWNWIRLQEH